ncbi:hypothetical protein E4665_00150 [Sporolactobacillus shoreae]|uniref:Glycosyltransferase RgtA/B/C/D-like domain-containing protein n=1 Tax=Sporolactobacillus shoreae TaxID=1465501 RepID=A0A4Z0GUS9_9BACL|nr:DUF6020 family protein [Sporolactobacillus shoreae]TGB00126.1 hypothetical protein E4665_00150 [Sporolactobacillus shoreae]
MNRKMTLYLALNLLIGLFVGTGAYFYTHSLQSTHLIPLFFFILLGAMMSFGTVSGRFVEPYRMLLKKTKVFVWLCLIFLAGIMTVALKPSQFHSWNYSLPTAAVFTLAAFLFVFFFILAIAWLILTFSRRNAESVPKKRYIFIYALLPFVLSLVYFWAFYPGILVIDSVNQWQQAHSTFFNDWHPVMMTWIILLTTKIWDNPAAFVILQFTIISGIVGYVIYAFKSLGLNRWLLIAGWLFLTFFPLDALYSVIIWKDTLYCYFLLWLTTMLILIIHTKGQWLKSYAHLFALYLSVAGLIFFRHNGFPVLLVTIVIFPFFFRKNYWRMYGVFIAAVITFLIVTGPVFKYYHVYPADKTESLGIPIQQIGGIIKDSGKMSASQQDFFNHIFPESKWKHVYQPSQVDPVKFHKGFNKMYLRTHPSGFVKNWAGIVLQNPKQATSAFLSMEQLVYKLNIPQSQMRPVFRYKAFSNYRPVYFLSARTIKKDHVKYKSFHYSLYGTQHANHFLASSIRRYNDLFLKGIARIFVLPALYLYLSILFLFVVVLKGGWKLSLAAVPAFLNLGSMAAAIPAQDPRYLFSNYLLFIPFLFLATLCAGKREKRV